MNALGGRSNNSSRAITPISSAATSSRSSLASSRGSVTNTKQKPTVNNTKGRRSTTTTRTTTTTTSSFSVTKTASTKKAKSAGVARRERRIGISSTASVANPDCGASVVTTSASSAAATKCTAISPPGKSATESGRAVGNRTTGQLTNSVLSLKSCIGFSGRVNGGLVYHYETQTLLVPSGSSVVLRKFNSEGSSVGGVLEGDILGGDVSCVSLSKSGTLVAYGTNAEPSVLADIFVCKHATLQCIHKFTQHRGGVRSLSFSPSEKYLLSLGHDNVISVWNLFSGKLFTYTSSRERLLCICFFNRADNMFLTAGEHTIQQWNVQEQAKIITPEEFQFGSLRRVITQLAINSTDSRVYCATTSGDVLDVDLKNRVFKNSGPCERQDAPRRRVFQQTALADRAEAPLIQCGVRAIALSNPECEIYVGSGDGVLYAIDNTMLTIKRQVQLEGAINSISDSGQGGLWVGTEKSKIYFVESTTLQATLLESAPCARVNGICFPHNFSDLFTTCSGSDICVWNSSTSQELLRISVLGVECLCVHIPKNGRSILSGWSDGKLRAHTPQTGRFKWEVNTCPQGVTAVATAPSSTIAVVGGANGEVCVWTLGKSSRGVEAILKDHKKMITALSFSESGDDFLTASHDGSCIIWNLRTLSHRAVFFYSTPILRAFFSADEQTVITVGTNNKFVVWAVESGVLLEEINLTSNSPITDLDVSSEYIVSAEKDRSIKMYNSDSGSAVAAGTAHHGAQITAVKVSPNGKFVVSVDKSGCVYTWEASN
ncbi:WD domain, G-beta repeat protein [Pelomyxa schiedti]|nr:WD domain, G-beta repeat protein [Pelomyxa schiedti]